MPAEHSLGHDLRSILAATTIGVTALVVGASLTPRATPTPHSVRADDWQLACRDRCELRTVVREGAHGKQWIGLVYTSGSEARVVSRHAHPLGAAVTFNDGRRFIFDFCDAAACRLPPADSTALLRRLRTDDSGTLRVRLASGGSTGLIDLPRLRNTTFAESGTP